MKLPSKKWIIVISIIIAFIILNPGLNQFEQYLGTNKSNDNLKRKYNLLFCSVYEEESYKTESYIGMLGNFIDITPKPKDEGSKDTIETTETKDTLPIIKKKIPSFDEVMGNTKK